MAMDALERALALKETDKKAAINVLHPIGMFMENSICGSYITVILIFLTPLILH